MENENAATPVVNENFGLSDHELAFLVRYLPEDQLRRTASLFRLPEPIEELREPLEAAVISSLVARGYLVVDAERGSLLPALEALVLTASLQHAEAWTTIQATDGGENSDVAVLVESPVGKFFAQPRAFDTWWFVLVDPTTPGQKLTTETVVQLAEAQPRTAVFTRFRNTELDRSITVHHASGVWSYAFGETGAPEPTERVEDSDREALDAGFGRFFAGLPVVVAGA